MSGLGEGSRKRIARYLVGCLSYKNVSEALERYLLRQHRSLRQAALEAQATPADPLVPPAAEGCHPSRGRSVEEPLEGMPPPSGGIPSSVQASRTRRLARYEEVMALHRQGTSARASATATGLSRATVNKFVQAGDFPERAARAAGVTHLTPFLDYLRARWESGGQNASLLWRELRERGFRGALSAVTRYLRSHRPCAPLLRRSRRAPRSYRGPARRGSGRPTRRLRDGHGGTCTAPGAQD